jgi:predicted regulator of Ras-like GTPase activity (Roadblock/LC7/MglB family)
LGIIFGQPLKSEWHPPEIVQKICGFGVVAGCILTTADGLLVAGQVPAPQKAEMLASFLPQIFSRMAQYSGELQIGGLNAMLLFTADAPCAIFRAGKIYLGVTGRAGESLPEAQLLRVAAELAKRNP